MGHSDFTLWSPPPPHPGQPQDLQAEACPYSTPPTSITLKPIAAFFCTRVLFGTGGTRSESQRPNIENPTQDYTRRSSESQRPNARARAKFPRTHTVYGTLRRFAVAVSTNVSVVSIRILPAVVSERLAHHFDLFVLLLQHLVQRLELRRLLHLELHLLPQLICFCRLHFHLLPKHL